MPGNEVGDRVHNFFAQDSLSLGQHHSQVVDGSWPGGNSLWAGNQAHIGLPSPISKNPNVQQSDIEREHSGHSFTVPHGLNFTQPTVRPEPHSQQPNLNGYIHGHQILQTRQNGSSFLGVDPESDRHNTTSRGLSIYESQQGNGSENRAPPVRSESSDSPVSFDFFGSQQQMSGQQTGMLQSLPRQQSELSDMQLLQQQVMLRKMQELQRRQQIQQMEAVRHNTLYQIPSVTKQAGSSSHSPALVNGTPISPMTEASSYPWATEPTAGNTSWLQHASPAIQGSSSGFRFSPEQGQSMSLMGLVPQQVNQSLYGVPVSNARGTHQYSHVQPDMRRMPISANSFTGNEFTGFPDQVNRPDGSFVSRQGPQGENLFGHASGEGFNTGMNLENIQQVNVLQRSSPLQEFHGRQELVGPSETLQEKTGMQVSSSQNVVALDPTEEKILFGDDNIWDAFGSSASAGAEGFNMLNDTGFSNGFPSVQSGSWSALMQSAVAETTSNDIGLQEEWNGMSFQDTEVAAGNRQPSRYDDSTKQRTVLASNNSQTASAWSSRSVTLSNDANVNPSYQGVLGLQQSAQKLSYEHGEKLQMDSTGRSVQKSSEEGSKWLSRGPLQKPLAEGSQGFGNATPLNAEMKIKSTSESGTHGQKVFSFNIGQPQDTPNGHNDGETVTLRLDAVSKTRANENNFEHLHEEMSNSSHLRKVSSGPKSTVGLHGKSLMGSSQVNKEGWNSNNVAVLPNSSTASATQENGQMLPNSCNFNHWKHAEGSDSGKFQHHVNKGLQFFESSMNNSDKDSIKIHETDNCDRKENSSDSHSSNLSQHPTTVGSRDNVWSDVSDSRNLPAGKHRLSKQGGRRTPGPRKFQYHPLGNLDEDVEPSYGRRHATHKQVTSQQIPRVSYSHNLGYFGQSNFFGQSPKTSTQIEKDFQGNKKEEDDTPSRGTLPGFTPDTSTPSSRSLTVHEPNKAAQSSQNMLELLHKVDQSQERGKSDGSVGPLKQNQSSASQGFSLQLAPPSHRWPIQNHASASPSSAQTVNSISSFHTTPERRENDRTWLVSTAQVQSLPSSLEGEFKFSRIGMPVQTGSEASQYSMQGNFSSAETSCFSHSRSQLQNQQMIGAIGTVTSNHPMNVSFNGHGSHNQQPDDCTSRALTGQSMQASLTDTAGIIPYDKPILSGDTSDPTDTNCSVVSSPQVSVVQVVASSQPFVSSGMSSEGAFPRTVPKSWTNVIGQHHLFGSQPHKFSSNISQSSQSNNNVLTSSPSLDQDDPNTQKGGNGLNGPSEFDVNSMDFQGFVGGEGRPTKESLHQLVSSCNNELAGKMTVSHGKDSLVINPSDTSPSNSALNQRDIEAFGRSLGPNNLLHQKYSLLHQMRAMKSVETDPSDRSLKRLKREDSGLGSQIAPKAGQSSVYDFHPGTVPSGDSKILSNLEQSDTWDRNASTQPDNVSSHDAPAFGRKDSENYSHRYSAASVGVEHSQISPQMAPSWFNQVGTFKNGQMLPSHDAQKNGAIKTVEPPQAGNIWQRSVEHFSSTRSLSPNATDQSLVVKRPKKRKSATSELLSWHKEVKQGSQSLLTISVSEVEWAKAANRLVDRVEDDAEMSEDRQTVLRPKRRLILTTQLMQQLFRPPPAAVLSADSSSNYETMAFLSARLALGDACSSMPCSGSKSRVLPDSSDLMSDKHKTTERIGVQHLSKVFEDFIARARKLENDFLRLDKRASVLDLRIENQDLEKFSVINRFAKFHGRGQADGANTSSSSDAPANAQRTFPQRYVTALPVPQKLPDRVQCLSL